MGVSKPRLHVTVTINGLGTISIIAHVLEPHALACCFVEEINLSCHCEGKEWEIRKELNFVYDREANCFLQRCHSQVGCFG